MSEARLRDLVSTPLTFGSLFAGFGLMDIGLERAGMECRWQCETNEYASRVLAINWPNVRRCGDVRTLRAHDCEPVDVLVGGFPCTDISNAGKKAGITGPESGLWSEYYRLIRGLLPRFVVIENVAALLRRGADTVLGNLAEIGYDAEWECIRASDFGAPHRRERLFIVAYPNSFGWPGWTGVFGEGRRQQLTDGSCRMGAWSLESPVRRVAYGVPHRMERLVGLGNGVVPDVAEWIGESIVNAAGTSGRINDQREERT